MDSSTFATPQHDLHKLRKAALAPYFSMQSVRRLQPVIQEKVDLLLGRLKEFRDKDEVLMASWAFSAYTNGKLTRSARQFGSFTDRSRHRDAVLFREM